MPVLTSAAARRRVPGVIRFRAPRSSSLPHRPQFDSDFRLISATNLSDKKLRERLDPDFFDRISMLTLRLPALREVPEEIPWLWEMVFDQASRRAGSGRIRLPDSAHRAIVRELMRHPLPGNLRDLFRVAYRTIAAKADRHAPLSATDASGYGLAGLDESRADAGADSIPRSVARAFAESLSLDSLISTGETIQTKAVDRALKGPGKSRPEARLAAFENQGGDAPGRALVDKIARRAWTVTDADVAAAKAEGVSEDEIFELTVCAAYGQATRQLNAALAALDEASSAFDTHERIDSGVAR